MKITTGVKRLDELLKGGLPERNSLLLFSPPFVGKDIILRQFILANLRAKVPVTLVLTDQTAADYHDILRKQDPTFAQLERGGLLRTVDTYSKSIGMREAATNTEYVDGLLNFNAVNTAVNNAQREFLRDHAQQAFVFDSVSTLIAYTNANTAFRYLQVLLGRVKAAGASSMLTLSHGMHSEAEVQMIKHLVDGFIELRAENEKPILKVEGVGLTDSRGWVEYRIAENRLDITGSFAAGRIR